MGQKVHPIGIRLGISTDWRSKWYAEGTEYAKFLLEDIKIREHLMRKLKHASVGDVRIERPAKSAFVTVHTARPGVVIGKKGEDIEKLRLEVASMMDLAPNNVKVNIEEIRKPELNALLVAESIAQQLERRIMFRRAMKRSIANTMRLGAKGIKVRIAGRLNGAEIARAEWAREGQVPLHTLRADIDYATATAATTYGNIGIKGWINHGEVFDLEEKINSRKQQNPAGRRKNNGGK